MQELTKDENDLQIGKDTYIQILNLWLRAINRQVFDKKKYFQYSKRVFRLCPIRSVMKHYTHQNTSGTN